MVKRNKAPLLDKIRNHLKTEVIGFHTPGHTQGKGCDQVFRRLMENGALKIDLTELPGLDNLRNPTECLDEAQNLAARLFDAHKTFFLVNGSTVGIQAALLAINRPQQEIVVSRNIHVSVINGLVLSGGRPVPVPVKIDYEWGIPLGTGQKQLVELIKEHPHSEALVITSPTYQGIGFDVSEIIQTSKKSGLSLIVDEAHGTHLYFQGEKKLSAQLNKPDIVVHSVHKTLPALTQASMLHVNNEKWIAPLQCALNILQTTSPSYLLLASLDGVQSQMSEEGKALISRTVELAKTFRLAVRKLAGYRIFETNEMSNWYYDETKVAVSAADLGLTGWKLAAVLLENYGIAVEMSDYYYVLFLVNTGHAFSDIEKVIRALEGIQKHNRGPALPCLQIPASLYENCTAPVFTPREVYYESKARVELSRTKGRIAGEPVAVYPPGVPLIWPGEIVQEKHVDYLTWAASQNLKIEGLYPGGLVSVVAKG